MNLTITIIQTNLAWEDKPKNLLHFSAKIAEIDAPTDLIVLPEMFSTGFSMSAKKLAETMQGKTMNWLQNESLKKNAAIVASFIVKENNTFFNRLVLMQPNGQYFYYDKKHLFSMASENINYSAGNNRLIVQLKGWKICPLVCYDLRFPVWSRNISFDTRNKSSAYDCLIYIANWPTTRVSHWDKLLEARAIENQCYVVGVNRIGTDESKLTYSGNSAIINPKGEKISTTQPFADNVETVTLNFDELEQYRKKFPLVNDADYFQFID